MARKIIGSDYPPEEERWNIGTHAFGLVLSILAFFLLFERAGDFENLRYTLSYSVFGFGLVLLYSASTLYHSSTSRTWRYRFKIFDHIAIFVLIAASYTPFAMITLRGTLGWIIFGTAWGIALAGTVIKVLFTGRYKIFSTALYVGMGWLILIAIGPLIEKLPAEGIGWLFAGGLFYTIGAVIYMANRVKYNHALFHLFVLFGSFSHFMAIWRYTGLV